MNNFIIRAITGVLFVAIMVGCIMCSPLSFLVLFTIITALTTWEFCTIMNNRGDVNINRLMATLSAAYLFVACWCASTAPSPLLFVPYIMAIVYLLFNELYRNNEHALNNWAFAMMSQLYIALPFSLLNILEFWQCPVPGLFALALFIFLWCSDTGAYCTGSLIGRNKLFPSVSPGKTWEGSIGGAAVAIAVSQLIATLAPLVDIDELHSRFFWAGMALTVIVFGTWGDLVESLMKRRLGIKDSGHALPGHGGWLDRFDSSLLAIPAVVIYMLCWFIE